MAAPKLTYFKIKGAAESARLAFVYGGVDFEDNRIGQDEWPSLKPTTPFGAVPTLHVNGKQYAQSKAILRYAGKLGGTYPSDPLEALEVDMVLEGIEDMFNKIRPTFAIKDQEEKLKARKELAEIEIPKFLSVFNQTIKSNGKEFLVGDKVTIADLQLYAVMSMLTSGFLDGISASIIEPYHEIKALCKLIGSDSKIKAYEAAAYPEQGKED